MCIISIKMSVKLLIGGFLGIWSPNLALFLQSEIAIPAKIHMLEVNHVMKLQDFPLASFVSKTNRKLMKSI